MIYRHTRRGFTLIELLVVVLIIGILAAVAVPQYQIAVAKSQFIQNIALCDGIYKAQQVYRLANGGYTNQLQNLDIDMPRDGVITETGNRIDFEDKELHLIVGPDSAPYCNVWHSGTPAYIHYYDGSRRECRAKKDNSVQNAVCKAMGGQYDSALTEHNIYVMP